MTTCEIVAKRYAQAFLNEYGTLLSEADCVQVGHVYNFLLRQRALRALLKVPHIPSDTKKAALEELFLKRFNLPASFNALITVLIQQRRTYLITPILKNIQVLYQVMHHIETFHITTAAPLAPEQLAFLQEFLAWYTNKKIFYTYEVDSSLIAGIRLQSATSLWEYSLNNQLNRMSHE